MRQVLTRITSCFLPIAITACVSNSPKPDTNLSQQLNEPSAALASAAAYDDQDMLSVLTHASLRRLAGDYRGSNTALDRAYSLNDELYTQSLSDLSAASLLNPGAAPYRPNRLEVGFVSYMKALNHLDMTQGNNALQQREAAAVEMRRLDILQGESRYLREMGDNSDRYDELAQFVVALFSERSKNALSEGLIDIQAPWLYALSAIIYEANNDLDSAQLAYRRALAMLPEGETTDVQHNLRQLILDNGHRCLSALGYEQRAIAESPFAAGGADSMTDGRWLIEHDGVLPAKAPLEMLLTADSVAQRLILRPMIRGSEAEKAAQRRLFAELSLHYDSPYKDAIVIELGDNWSAADSLGLTATIGGGVRIFIDYLADDAAEQPTTLQTVSGQQLPLTTIADIAGDLRRYEALTLQYRFEEALLRELSKSAGYKSMTGGISLPFSLGGALATFSAAADLRQWQLLPARIRVSRIPEAALGDGELELISGTDRQRLTVTSDQTVLTHHQY